MLLINDIMVNTINGAVIPLSNSSYYTELDVEYNKNVTSGKASG